MSDADRLTIDRLGPGISRLIAAWGFLESPDVPRAIRLARAHGVPVDDEVTYFLNRITLNPGSRPGMALWRKRLFVAMSRNSLRASTHLRVPSRDVVEVGTQLDI